MVEWKKLGDMALYYRGVTYNKKQEVAINSGGTKILRANNITLENNSLNFDDIKEIDSSVKIKDDQWLYPNDILICAGSGSKEHVGKVAYIKEKIDYAYGGFMGKIISKHCLNSRYLFHILCGQMFKDYLKVALNSTTINNLNLEIINNFRLPTPSLSEQTRIVGILDTFTASIDNLKEQIAQRRKQYEYYRDQLLDLEGKEGVEMKKLGDICDIFDGTHQTPRYTESGISFVSVENIKNLRASTKFISTQDYELNYRVKPQRNDVLMTRIGDVGSCAVINFDEPIAYYVSLSLLRPNLEFVISNFVKYLLESQTGRREVRKKTLLTAVPLKINLGDIGKLVLPVPSLQEQQQIVDILDTFEASIQNLEAQLSQREKQYEYYRNKLLTFE